jgi:hypothetical protein
MSFALPDFWVRFVDLVPIPQHSDGMPGVHATRVR